MIEYASPLMEHLQARRPAMVSLLERLVARESPSDQPQSLAEASSLLADALQERGFEVRYVHDSGGGRHMMARPLQRRRGGGFQLLIGHVDTVWPLGSLREMPLINDGENLSGPGIYDMKGGLVQALFALEAVSEVVGAPPVTPVFFINSDEEIGSRGSRRYIERLARCADRAFVMEPSLGPEGRLKTASKGVGRYLLRIKGRAAHAGLDPGAGASAILELSHQIQRLFALNDPASGVTVNVGVVDGGLQPNVVAPESRAKIDVRVPDHAAAQRVDAAIRGLQPTLEGVSLEVEGSIARPPMERTDDGRRLWKLAREAAAALGTEIGQGMAGGGSDGNFTSQFTPTLDGLGAVGDGAHAQHEYLRIGALCERAALLGLLLLAPAMRH